MNRYSTRARRLGIGVWILAGALAVAPAASDAQVQTAAAAPIEKIEVTGSAIRRTDTETPSPVQIITSEDLKRTGYTDVSDVLRNVAANGAGSLSQSFNFAFAGGASGIALRGLAVGDTLVLIDGHRQAPYSLSDDNQRNFVDVSNIPLDAIDHVEILRDGASSLYGSDAIAGVVNIILKKSFKGLHVSGDYGQTQRGDGGTAHISGIYGIGDMEADGHNLWVALEYRHQDSVQVNNRHGLWNADNPLNWVKLGGQNVTPGVPNQQNGGSFAGGLQSNTGVLQNPADSTQFTWLPGCNQVAQAAGKCGFLFNGLLIQPTSENINLTSKFNLKLPGDWKSATEFSVWQSRTEQVSPPFPYNVFASNYPSGFVGISTAGPTPVLAPGSPFITTVPVGYPGNPYSAPAPLIYTYGDVGNPQFHFASANYRFVEDLQGSVLGWDLNAAAGLTYVHTDETAKNYLHFPNLQTALNNCAANPASPLCYHVGQASNLNTQAVYNFIAPEEFYGASDLLDFINVKGSRDLLQLWGGPLSTAVGAEVYHKNQNAQDANTVIHGLQSGVTGFAIGHQNDAGIYAEVDAQVLTHLEFDAALRADHEWTDYGAYGNAVKPHVGFKASPIDILTLRGTWSEGYRLPTAAESGVSASLFGASGINDPLLCPGGPTTPMNISSTAPYYFPSQCELTPVNVQTPTKSLSPERSDNWTLGFILEPTKWLYTSVDYFDYRIKDQIWSPFELGGLLSFGQYKRGPAGILLPAVNATTGAPAGNQATPDGLILYNSFPYLNASGTRITGFDFEFRLKFDLSEFGRLVADLTATHQFKYDISSFGTTWKLAGTQGPSGVSGDTGNPRNRAQASLTWDKGQAEVTLNVNYIGRWSTNDPSAVTGSQTSPCQGPPGGLSTTYSIGAPFAFGVEPNLCYVASWTDFDLYASYRIDKHWSIHGAIMNLFDRAPSIDASTYGGGGGGFWSTLETAGAVGRFFTGGVAYDF
jgi:iron complex outermembrane receptor protein